ncbi:MAG TPA: aminotransferase class V-fold PLP-dependent enzyme [Sandaracinaceae bacterium LLY-WYZ-13_1]|nr:aminotransferase class V-fold PLP-dependent enzyme [Sandaracinaceae bacterium LLY-WYZ-13_1]
MTTLDTAWVRAQFPGLDDEVALFDNAGGSVPARPVIEGIERYLRGDMVQLGASYPRSRRATERVDAGKAAAARLVGAPADEIVLGASTTVNLYVLAHALAPRLAPGDEVVVTDLDHEANRGAWIRVAEARGATVRTWAVDRASHELTLDGLEAVLSERTRLVAFTHCANVVGSIHDARAFVARVREAGALTCVDGVAFAPHRRVDVGTIGADVYALSLYKVYGPHLGLMHVRRDLLESLRNQNHFFLEGTGAYQLMPGNVSHELAAGVAGVPTYLDALAAHHGVDDPWPAITAHETALTERLLAYLRDHRAVRILGRDQAEGARRVPTVAFTVEGRRSADVVAALDEHGVALRFGHFYARRAMDAFDLDPADGIVRASLVHYDTLAEVDRLTAALDAVL